MLAYVDLRGLDGREGVEQLLRDDTEVLEQRSGLVLAVLAYKGTKVVHA